MKTKFANLFTEEMFVEIMGWLCVVMLVSLPFLLIFVAKSPTECLVKTTERGNRLHIVLDCPMIPASAHVAPTDEK